MLELWNQDMSLLSLIQFLTLNRTLNWSGTAFSVLNTVNHAPWMTFEEQSKKRWIFWGFSNEICIYFLGHITELSYPSLLTWALDLFTREIKEKQWWRGGVGGGTTVSRGGYFEVFSNEIFIYCHGKMLCKGFCAKLVEPAPKENFGLKRR